MKRKPAGSSVFGSGDSSDAQLGFFFIVNETQNAGFASGQEYDCEIDA
jgi:hypothetical protein